MHFTDSSTFFIQFAIYTNLCLSAVAIGIAILNKMDALALDTAIKTAERGATLADAE